MGLLLLTPDGVTKKLKRLYRLSNKQLQLLAELIRLEFKDYIRDNFLLSEKQIECLENMDEAVANYYGSQCCICFIHRLPIELVYPLPLSPEYTKWIVASNNIIVAADGTGQSEVYGSLIFTMTDKV